MLRKLKGFLMVEAVMTCVVFSLLGLSLTQIMGGSLASLAVTKNAIQGQQYAKMEATGLKGLSYEALSSVIHGKQPIKNGNGWMSEVAVGVEQVNNGIKFRTATVNVYKTMGSSSPAFSLNVPLSSQGSLSELRNQLSTLQGNVNGLNGRMNSLSSSVDTLAAKIDSQSATENSEDKKWIDLIHQYLIHEPYPHYTWNFNEYWVKDHSGASVPPAIEGLIRAICIGYDDCYGD